MLEVRGDRIGKATVAGRLTDSLRKDILTGALAPGVRLNLDRMRERLSVSVGSLREAVTRLVADGLILAEEQKGYQVAPISLADLEEVMRLRMELEPLALRAAIAKGGLDWETEVMAALYRLDHTRRVAEEPATLEAWEAAHDAFHRALIAPCQMPLLQRFHDQLLTMSNRYRRIVLAAGGGERDVAREHAAIAEAATRREAEVAATRLRAHIARTGTTLRRHIAERTAEASR